MAIIRCSECGKEISDQAKACIHCGCPLSVTLEKVFKITKCPDCGTERKPGDTKCYCGLIYKAYENSLARKRVDKAKPAETPKVEEIKLPKPGPEKPKTNPLTMGCAVIFVFFMVITVIGLMNNGGGSESTKPKKSTQIAEWYAGGTLHGATVSNWNKASYSNKLATAADWVVNISPRIKAEVQQSGSMDALRSYAAELVTCVNEAAAGQGYGNVNVGELAASCGVIMGWTR